VHLQGFLDVVLGLELGQQAVDVVDVPRPFDLGDHDHVKLVADRRDDREQVVEDPGAIEAVDAGPKGRLAEIVLLRDIDQPFARRLLVGRRDRIFQVAQEDIDLRDEVRDLGTHLLQLRREEVNHAVRPRGHRGGRLRRAGGERDEEGSGITHANVSIGRRI
jgi:hypothetical protein